MPLENKADSALAAAAGGPGAGRANAEQLADAIVAVWREIDHALHPIIGHRGVAALYNRSLQARRGRPPVAGRRPGGRAGRHRLDGAARRPAAAAAADAAAAGTALFQTFQQLLASLIGASLTERLLQSRLDPPSGRPPAQDTTP